MLKMNICSKRIYQNDEFVDYFKISRHENNEFLHFLKISNNEGKHTHTNTSETEYWYINVVYTTQHIEHQLKHAVIIQHVRVQPTLTSNTHLT